MDSAGVAAWIAYIAFVALVVLGLAFGELRFRGIAVALLICAVARLALAYVSFDAIFPSVVALVDVALVFVVLKGDVKL